MRIWITPKTVEVPLDYVPKYEEISSKVAELAANGASINNIAATLRKTWTTIDEALVFARTGQRPRRKPA